MSTQPVPRVSGIKKVFASFGHAVAWAAKWISKEAHAVGNALSSPQAAQIETTVENISKLFLPSQVVAYEDLAFRSLGTIAQALKSAGDAADAQGLNVSLDAQFKTDLLACIAAIEAALAKGTSPVPPVK